MNILNRSPPGSGQIGNPAPFPGLGGHRPSGHDHRRQDACQRLLPVVLPSSPASNPLRSFQPCTSTRTPRVVANRGGFLPGERRPLDQEADAARKPPAVKDQGRRMGGEVVAPDSMEVGSSLAGAVEFDPRCAALGFIRSFMEDAKLRLVQEYNGAVGGDLDRQLSTPEEPPPSSVITLAVSVSSAVKLDGKQMEKIAKKMRRLTGLTNLRLENKVDPSLIAGIIISYGVGDEHVIDLSVKGHLAELEARLESSDQNGAGGWSFFK